MILYNLNSLNETIDCVSRVWNKTHTHTHTRGDGVQLQAQQLHDANDVEAARTLHANS